MATRQFGEHAISWKSSKKPSSHRAICRCFGNLVPETGKRVILLIVCTVLACGALLAQGKGHGVEVRAVSTKLPDAGPGMVVSASFLVTNTSPSEEEFIEALELPKGWQVITAPTSFVLSPQEQQVRIMAFVVPVNAAAGAYKATYSVRSQRDYAIQDFDRVTVAVPAVSKLVCLQEEKPDSVIAGDEYQVKARLVNQGNSRIQAIIEGRSTQGYAVKVEPAEFALEPGAGQLVTATVKTANSARRLVDDTLMLTARVPDAPDACTAGLTTTVQVVPKISGQPDLYHRLPAQLKLRVAGDNDNTAAQAELYGEGTLDEDGARGLDFLFRGPDIQDATPFGERDEYRLNYLTRAFDLHLGDQSYGLSYLTDYYRYGRGAGLTLNPSGRLGAGAFFLQSRWRSPQTDEFGAYVSSRFSDKFELKLNYLNKEQSTPSGTSDTLTSVETYLAPMKDVNLHAEYGTSSTDRPGQDNDSAYSVRLSGNRHDAYYSIEKIHAGPDYHGYYSNTDYTNLAMALPVTSQLRARASYQRWMDNLDLDPTLLDAGEETYYQTGLSYSLRGNANLSLDYNTFRREDRMAPVLYDFRERSIRLGWGRAFANSSVQAYAERGKLDDLLSGSTNSSTRYYLYYNVRTSPRQFLSFFGQMGDKRPSESRLLGGDNSVGIFGNWLPSRNLSINLQYATNALDANRQVTRRQAYLVTTYRMSNGRMWTLRVRNLSQSQRPAETGFLVSYTIPLDIPVAKKRSVGTIRGRIYDAERPGNPGIARAIVTSAGGTAVTDEFGKFVLASLQPGECFISLDKHSIGLDRITEERLPLVANVKGGETVDLQIPVIRSARVQGRVVEFAYATGSEGASDLLNRDGVLYVEGAGDRRGSITDASGSSPGSESLIENCGLGSILVELTDGTDTIRRVTDNRGHFSLQDLRPGKYTLRVVDANLPAFHYLETSQMSLDLKPAEEENVVIRILPRLRPIKVIEDGTLVAEAKG